jgi:predicted regulator of Ras-like GTPase activity (Roadblock/LC7/MglB family)
MGRRELGARVSPSYAADASVFFFQHPGLFANVSDMFQNVLKEVVENTEGGLASLLMDFEGIAVESYSKPGAHFDITTIGAEFSVVVKSIQRAAQMLEAGETAEVAIQAEKMTTLIRVVNATYFVAFSMTPDANVGKARYMLRTKVPALAKDLA